MDPARWAEVERLFLEASARPPSEREPFLQASPGDPEALAEVRALLAAEAEAEAFFAAPSPALALLAEGGPPAGDELEDDLPEGTRVGPYRVEAEVGRGGMGSVYRARRADGAFEQTVAVKVVRRGLDTADVLRRFRQERALLAGLDHPHVARLLDGGSTADGRPYLAMEFVQGEPITAYADRQGLGVEARLRLLLQVCDAVAYAHRRLVVHRDLKPSNVLVTEEGAVKLLDFGIAKLLGDETEDAPLTRTGHALLTPEYAAPEQMSGAPVTTSADVYALGVVLYELLAGARPARPTPTRPSTAATSPEAAARRGTTPERLRRRLAGDLDRIALKALHPDPERRYPSADALADDLRRYLGGLPVQARPDSPAYRARRFVGRHRLGVASALGLVVLLAGFAASRAALQRETARERDRAEASVEFLRSLLAGANALEQGRGDVTVAEMLASAARRVEAELSAQPEVQAGLLLTIGEAYVGLARYDEAEPALRRALPLLEGHRPPSDPDRERALRALALVVTERGALDEAAALYREALAAHRQRHGSPSAGAVEILGYLAWTEKERARYDEAEALLRQALAEGRRLPADSAAASATARVASILSVNLMRRGAYEEAEGLERSVLAERERWLGPDHPLTALALSNLAKVLEDGGRSLEEALALNERALALRVAIGGDSSVAAIVSRANQANVLRGLGRHAEAVAEGRRAFETARAVFGEGHTTPAYAAYAYAAALHAAGETALAEAAYRDALDRHVALWGMEHPYTAYVLVPYARLHLERGDPAGAARLARPAVEARRAALPPENPLLADAEAALAEALARGGDALATAPLP